MEYVCCSYDFVSLQQNLGTQEISKKNLKNSQMADYVKKVKISIFFNSQMADYVKKVKISIFYN